MPSEIMSQGHISSLRMPSSSFFSEEIRLPNERQFGIEDLESVPDHSERTTGTPMASSRANDLCTESGSLFVARNNVGLNRSHYESHLFSSSFSEIFDKKLRLLSNNESFGQSATIMNSNLGKDEPFEPSEEIESQAIGNLLPDDDDDLLYDVVNDNGYGGKFCDRDDTDDIFFSGGGMEIEADDIFNHSRTSDYAGQEGSNGSEYSNSEHPSRTLFVRNISSNVEDAELNTLFEQFGDIQTLHTACKHRGFIMISYFDIRAACNAMRSLQDKTLKHQKLKIHFYIPKNNLSEEDTDHGTLVVLNLGSSLSNDDIHQTFGIYGEIKEIREKPHKHPHKLIEFYDVRAAEAALCALNRSDIAGSKTKADSVHPGVARWCLSHESEQEEPSGCRQGSLPYNSPSGFYGSIQNDVIKSCDNYNGPIQGLYSSVPPSVSFPVRITPAGNQINHGELSHSLGQLNVGFQHMPNFHSHSVPEYHDSLVHGFPCNSTSTISSMATDPDGSRHIHRLGSGRINNHFENNEAGGFGVPSKYIRNIANSYHRQSPAPMIWPNSPAFFNNVPARPLLQMCGFPGTPPHMLNSVLPLEHHHVGSAPAMNPSLWDNQQDLLSLHPGSLGNRMFSCNYPIHRVKFATHGIFPHAGGNYINPVHGAIHSSQDRSLMFHGRNTEVSPSFDGPNDRIRIRRTVANANHLDNKRQYELDIVRITRGEDSRTTLMLKNIPNKYTSKMLLATIDEHNRGTYDFIYLPIDFKNKCNVGYAFINMINAQHIIPFHQAFNGKKWEKFNSEKVASLAYARIQGKTALIAHFQNSSLMNEDKRCRPILFHSYGPNAGDQEPFPMGDNIRSRPAKFRTAGSEDNHQESPSTSPKGEDDYIGTVSSLRSSKESE